jgi:CRP-like cAMP-binding protein
MHGIQRLQVIGVDSPPDADDGDTSRGRTSKAGWFLRTMGYTGRNSVSQHVEDWRQGKLLEDALSPGGDGVGRGARGVMGAQRHRPSSPAPRSSLRAEAGEVVRQTVALSVPPEKRTEEHVAEIVAVLVNVFENDFLPLYPESVQRELCRHLRLETFRGRECIFREGSTGSKLYVVVTGRVGMTRKTNASRTADYPEPNPSHSAWVKATTAVKSAGWLGRIKLPQKRRPRISAVPEVPAEVVTPGNSFGLLALYADNEKRGATANAIEPNTTLLSIARETYAAGRYPSPKIFEATEYM